MNPINENNLTEQSLIDWPKNRKVGAWTRNPTPTLVPSYYTLGRIIHKLLYKDYEKNNYTK